MFLSHPLPAHRGSRYGAQENTRDKSAALLFALVLTAALFGLILLVGKPRLKPDAPDTNLVILTASQIPDEDRKPDQEENIDQPEVFADSPEEAAPQSRPRTIAPAPAMPVIPQAAIDLAPLDLPAIPRTGDGPIITPGANSRGDQARGPEGRGGAGGDGLSGNGSGGAGNGKGRGSMLIASWAPGMDFSRNYRVYPPAARKARIEGAAYLRCFVLRRDRVRDCTLVREEPQGHGFGEAALKTEPWMRIRVHNQAGRRIYNQWVVVKSYFVLPPDDEGEDEDGAAAAPVAASAEAAP